MIIDMCKCKLKKVNTSLIGAILNPIILILIIVLNCFSSSKLPIVPYDTEIELLRKYSNLNSFDNVCSTFALDSDSSNDELKSFFTATYPENFNNSQNRFLSINTTNGLASFNCFFNDEKLPFSVKIADGGTYTNQIIVDSDGYSYTRFETICINLLSFRDKSEELVYDLNSYDGVIYLPDYIADYIIEKEGLTNYTELFSDSYSFLLTFNNKEYRYKVANIFHVDGFNSNYSGFESKYNDYNNGKKIEEFLGEYVFITNRNRVIQDSSGVLFSSLVNVLTPKIYIFDQFYKSLVNYLNSCEISFNEILQIANGNNIIDYDRNDEILDSYLLSKTFFTNVNDVLLILLFVVFLILTIALVYIGYKFKFKLVLMELFLTSFVSLIIAFILKLSILEYNVFIFLNSFSLILPAVCMAISLILFAILIYKEKKYE